MADYYHIRMKPRWGFLHLNLEVQSATWVHVATGSGEACSPIGNLVGKVESGEDRNLMTLPWWIARACCPSHSKLPLYPFCFAF